MHSRVDDVRRPRWAAAALSGLLLTLCTASWAAAQVSRVQETPAVAPADAFSAGGVRGVLEQGQHLENARRWAEALSLYEESLRDFPDSEPLRQRQDVARLHYCLERRYADQSFLQSVETLNGPQALALYHELLRKIDAHYVQAPPWARLASRGSAALDLALSDPSFCRAHLLAGRPDRLAGFRGDLFRLTAERAVEGPKDLVQLASDVAALAEQRLGLRPAAAVLEFVTAAGGGLDDYSAYLTAGQLRDVYSQIEGNFVGLGVELKADRGALLIVHVIPGSPAERAGILDGDRITAVDGTSTAQLSTEEAAALLTGEEGTYVRVTAVTAGGSERILTVRREHVEVPGLEDVKILAADYGIAYVKIPAFQKSTARDLEAALWDLHRQGMRSLILDLRGNPGGLLTASVEVADKFLTQGGIVSTRGRSPQEDFNYQAHYGGTWPVPLVVLIDRDSASASEIFAGAIRDNRRGDVIGERSFGKGSVQGIFPLGYAGAGIRLTTAQFYSPSGQQISRQGVLPTQQVTVAARPIYGAAATSRPQASADAILEAGLEAARRRLASRTDP